MGGAAQRSEGPALGPTVRRPPEATTNAKQTPWTSAGWLHLDGGDHVGPCRVGAPTGGHLCPGSRGDERSRELRRGTNTRHRAGNT